MPIVLLYLAGAIISGTILFIASIWTIYKGSQATEGTTNKREEKKISNTLSERRMFVFIIASIFAGFCYLYAANSNNVVEGYVVKFIFDKNVPGAFIFLACVGIGSIYSLLLNIFIILGMACSFI